MPGVKGPRGILRELGLAPARRRSQNFLKDKEAARRMALLARDEALAAGQPAVPGSAGEGRAAHPLALEVGPGLGALTRPLLDAGLRVCAVELDRGLCAELMKWPEALSGALDPVCADVLKVDAARDLPRGIRCVCGNLPYGISTPFLFWFLESFGGSLPGVFMVQKEVADRLAAPPGGKEYGRLSVALGSWFSVSVAFALGPGAFHPRPRVDSAVAVLRPLKRRPSVTPGLLGRMTGICFHSRRKTLFNNLAAAFTKDKARNALESLGVDGRARPEELPPEDYQRLAAAFAGEPGMGGSHAAGGEEDGV
ncbi:MAG: 16S rRNA (adenine(1518)-N(6)/adenine(1519)-N(6))-dimethyltransferase RsmA [Deltaproteobacteria bacterium]|jgi:16S rRNA (adenine1518-N6/adenine1519-N6)-dimethyltransferase|nr:16S rRNA (adenine(1518)-N(6)/adenine(1519)-N(6))-dimethyltransferase RsmA [Deltaproteobacteria bacterium]